MWTRQELKIRAKTALSQSYWNALLTCLLFLLIDGAALSFVVWFPAAPVAVALFLTFPLTVGLYYYFIKARNNFPETTHLFFAFEGSRYMSIVGSMAWMLLFLILWTIIPVAGVVLGIIKGISYSMTPFILTDNPTIGYERALKLSMAMTEGHKGAIFILYLSFIGWGILASIPMGLGWPFLMPYIYATFTELYVELKKQALSSGLCTRQELNIF